MEDSVIYRTPLGSLKLVANREGICAVKWLFGKHAGVIESRGPEPKVDPPVGSSEKTPMPMDATKLTEPQEHLNVCTRWLDAYFDGSLLKSKCRPLRPSLVLPQRGQFYHSVWDALIAIDIGETITYKELAKLSGNPKAARAVGGAVKSHCLPILVPCHRVVKSASSRSAALSGGGVSKKTGYPPYEVGGYSGGEGVETKQWLLEHEKNMIKDINTSTI